MLSKPVLAQANGCDPGYPGRSLDRHGRIGNIAPMLMIDVAPEALTGRIGQWLTGTPERDPEFVQAIYAALHRLAAQALAREGGAHTLQATALLNEAFLDLSQRNTRFRDRGHFFATATLCMRHILVDHARRKKADKRGDGLHAEWGEAMQESVVGGTLDVDLIALDLAMDQLHDSDARRAQIVQLAYFGGFKREEIAELLHVSLRTVDRELRLGEAWLAQALA
jgi:RNA polymerase sigma factor (TIGR02999 family)